MTSEPEQMKIMYPYELRNREGLPKTVPFSLLNEDWADRIHSQTLKRLNERGGLCPSEIIVNIQRLSSVAFHTLKNDDCIELIKKILNQ